VLGAGISGCSCAWQLSKIAVGPISVSVFEMGRGAGGRAATRRSRDLPGLALNHGAPIFHHSHSNLVATPLLTALLASKSISEWEGTFGKVDAQSGKLGIGAASRGEPSPDQASFSRYAGRPGMSSIADGILKHAGDGNVKTTFGTKITTIKPCLDRARLCWELVDKDGQSLGEFDWVVVTSASVAHPRWRQTFAEEPPMYLAAEALGSSQLTSAIDRLKSLEFTGVHVAMLAWRIPEGEPQPEFVQDLKKLPFDIIEVAGDDVLSKVVRQSTEPPYAAVLLYSTAALSEEHAQVFGSGGTAARMGASAGSPEAENVVVEKLHLAFQHLLTERFGAKEMPAPTWGPTLHRWGSAFPQGSATAHDAPACVLPEARIAFAGDFLAPPYACVETAMSSGIVAARHILRLQAAKRYVDLANQHDREGLLAMLATPCDMFGEPASKEGMDWYFDTYVEVHFEITSEFDLAEGDPRTVEFGYIRSWKDGDKRMQVEVTEFFTFAETEALIERIGYVKPPTEPVEQCIEKARNCKI